MSEEKKIIEEYRGARRLVYAEITADTADTYTTGTVKELAGVAEITKEVNTDVDSKYYDNGLAFNTRAVGPDEITLNVSALSNEVLADITGQVYDEETGAIIEGTETLKYFALGYITGKTGDSGESEVLVWRLKGTFDIPSMTTKTKDDSTDSEGQELKFTGIHTRKLWSEFPDSNGNPAPQKGLNVPLGEKVTETEFFAKVFTPTDLAAKKNN